MSFTEAQKVKIRKYLGWPVYQIFSTIVENTIEHTGQVPEQQAAIEAVLANLATIETEIGELHGIAIAESIEGSKLNPRRYEDLRAAGRRECQSLAIMLNTNVIRDVFGGGWRGGAMRMG